jgi:hypothetical protein
LGKDAKWRDSKGAIAAVYLNFTMNVFVAAELDYGLMILGRGDLVLIYRAFADMVDYPWVKDVGIKTEEELKSYLLKKYPEMVQKAQQAVARHEQTGFLNWYDWSIANWGTKRSATDFCLSKDEPTCLECFSYTAWSPPESVWKKMGEMFPTLMFELSGYEPKSPSVCRQPGAIRSFSTALASRQLCQTVFQSASGALRERKAIL